MKNHLLVIYNNLTLTARGHQISTEMLRKTLRNGLIRFPQVSLQWLQQEIKQASLNYL